MISEAEFDSLEVGDEMRANPLLRAFDPDAAVTLVVMDRNTDHVEFDVSYMSVSLGTWVCSRDGNPLKWTFL